MWATITAPREAPNKDYRGILWVPGASIWIHYFLHRLLFHGVDWATGSIQTSRTALPAFLCTITLPGVTLNSTFPLSRLVPSLCCSRWSNPSPKTNLVPSPAFINHSRTACVTCLFVWVLTELQPAASLRSGISPPITPSFQTHLTVAVTQQPPIMNNNESLGLHLVPLLNLHWSTRNL